MKSLVEPTNFSLSLSNIYLKTECGQFFIVGCNYIPCVKSTHLTFKM